MNKNNAFIFAPQLNIPHNIHDISFYTKAFDAVELRRFTNGDGSIHVAELSMGGALFHLHEEGERASSFSPEKLNGTTATIGLFVPDVDKILEKAEAAGATITQPVQDYDYGYRQGKFRDPFGHLWLIEKKI